MMTQIALVGAYINGMICFFTHFGFEYYSKEVCDHVKNLTMLCMFLYLNHKTPPPSQCRITLIKADFMFSKQCVFLQH